MIVSPSSSDTKPHVVVVGAGPGGLTSAMLLASRGFKVSVFEKRDQVGGRNGELKLGPYSFDIGPTFLMMKFLLDEVFEESGLSSTEYMEFVRLDPMYRLQFPDVTLEPGNDPDATAAQIARAFPGNEDGYHKFLEKEQVRFAKMLPCLQTPYSSIFKMLSPDLLKALPHLSLGRSLFNEMGRYFGPEELRLAFTFQSKYLGMSPWECPAAFAILSYLEHAFGVFHVMGGLNRISQGLARAATELGAEIHLETPVRQVMIEGRSVKGVELENGEKVTCDDVVINADFAQAMTTLVPPDALRKYTGDRIERMRYSCSTFMLYLGLDTLYDMPHHTVLFAKNYRRNIEDIFQNYRLPEDFSLYVRNASITDPELAPEGHSAVYVLVPVPNLKADLDWAREAPVFRERVLKTIQDRTDMKDLTSHIREERVYTPDDWLHEHDVYRGATFNLAHTIGQMLYFRPRNRFEEFDHCYLAGGGTHPGSGLPTIIESGRIAANLISRAHSVSFLSMNVKA